MTLKVIKIYNNNKRIFLINKIDRNSIFVVTKEKRYKGQKIEKESRNKE